MEMSLIQMFQDRGCLQLADSDRFTYASGLKGPIYCDNRLILGSPKLRDETMKQLTRLVKSSEINFDAIMAMATGAIALGSLLAQELELPLGYVRSQKKGHGKGALIEGGVDKAKKILIFEDLINQGSSIKKGIEALKEEGYEIVGVLSIVNYEFNVVKDYFNEQNIPLLSAIGFGDLLEFFEATSEGSQIKEALTRWHAQLNG